MDLQIQEALKEMTEHYYDLAVTFPMLWITLYNDPRLPAETNRELAIVAVSKGWRPERWQEIKANTAAFMTGQLTAKELMGIYPSDQPASASH